jgi:hypothetical protein
MIYKSIFDKVFNDDDDITRIDYDKAIKVFGAGLEEGVKSVFDKYNYVDLYDEVLLDGIYEDVIIFSMGFILATDEEGLDDLYGTVNVELKLSTFELAGVESYLD